MLLLPVCHTPPPRPPSAKSAAPFAPVIVKISVPSLEERRFSIVTVRPPVSPPRPAVPAAKPLPRRRS